ncbi:hypothetical protein L6R29_08190 [Myxococcota bacterium]|nr:hypothetical protein [Myxococcota bacterium]
MIRASKRPLPTLRLVLLGFVLFLGNNSLGCITIIAECLEDTNCPAARKFCIAGRCRACRNDKDCEAGQYCAFWACQPDPRGSFATCGDSVCDPRENCRTCPADCGACTSASCGNQRCDVGEDCKTCPSDCGPCAQTCNDKICQSTETCKTCPDDCGKCKEQCGNAVCEQNEDCTICEADCGKCATSCGNAKCELSENCQTCPQDCGKCSDNCGDTICQDNEDCKNCPQDCGKCATSCGNAKCEPNEDCKTCEADCGTCQAKCGDKICQNTETCASCPEDCGPCPATCGDGKCEQNEDCKTCAQDCGPCPATCGDKSCGIGEDCNNCPDDCGKCAPNCGNKICNADENCKTCPQDCGTCAPNCGNAKCEPGETCNNCAPDCGKCEPKCGNKICDTNETCSDCPDDCGTCPIQCGNGKCETGETCTSCPKDCGACPPQCGDGKCETGETCTSCPKDCGPCPDQCGDGVCGPTEGCSTCPADCKSCAGQKCQTDAECGAGFLCLEPDYNNPAKDKFCFQSCSNDLLRCLSNTDGRTRCAPLTASLRVCLKDAKASEDCGQKAKFQSRCLDNPPLYCSATSSLCQTPTIQTQPGAACDIPPYTTEPPKLCDPNQKLVCDPQSKTCTAAQQSDEGKECDPSGLVLGQKVLCTGSQLCIDFGPFGQRCHRPCSVGAPDACAHNTDLSCQTISFAPGSPSVCMDLKCNSDADCAFVDYVCSGTPGTPKVCRPPGPVGPLDFGAVCSTDPTQAKTSGCKSGLICIPRTNSQSLGVCSRDCTVDATVCQPFSVGGTTYITQCESSTLGFKACGVLCQGGSLQCPPATSCNNGRCAP